MRPRDEPELDFPAEIARREARLAVIQAAKGRPEARQREADAACGPNANDDRRPRHPDGTLKRGGNKYKRDFGVPAPTDHESFADPDSRIMKHASGGFEYSYSTHTAVDAAHQTVVAAELTNNAADSDRLPPLLQAVNRTGS
jgi:hypothetical protein